MRRSPDPLWHCLAALKISPGRVVLAVAFGVAALGSALTLAGLSAWLITRAWQMPPVLDLSVAVVSVRALGISRGIWRYCERLAGHDVALRAAATARTALYARMAQPDAPAMRSATLLDRLGADVDELAEVVVRSLIPIAVAVILSISATAVIALISTPAALTLAVAFVVAGVLAPALAARSAVIREIDSAHARSEHTAATLTVLEHSPELRVGGALDHCLADARRRRETWESAQDRAAGPAAAAAAAPTLATGAAVLGALACATQLAGSIAPTTVAILVLLPLAAFEATAALPTAAVGLSRSRVAARHLQNLLGAAAATGPLADAARGSAVPAAGLHCRELSWQAGNFVRGPITVELAAGERLAVTGPSGAGKTSLLMTLAGLTPAHDGSVRVASRVVGELQGHELPLYVGFFAEDAHLFATTVRDNLLVARGDADDAELTAALHAVGLHSWLGTLADGLDTVLDSGTASVSGGQRRRLLLARAILSRAPVVLLDEPTENLDATDAEAVLRDLLDPHGSLLPGRTVVVATHDLPAGIGCPRLHVGDTVHA